MNSLFSQLEKIFAKIGDTFANLNKLVSAWRNSIMDTLEFLDKLKK